VSLEGTMAGRVAPEETHHAATCSTSLIIKCCQPRHQHVKLMPNTARCHCTAAGNMGFHDIIKTYIHFMQWLLR